MYAVIKTGGKQYRVAAGDKIQIEKLEGNPGDTVNFAEVLMIANGEAVSIGAPHVAGATVVGEIASQDRGPASSSSRSAAASITAAATATGRTSPR